MVCCSVRLVVNTARAQTHTLTHTLPLLSPLIKSTGYCLCSELRSALRCRLAHFTNMFLKEAFCFATQHCYSVNTCSALYSMTPQAFGYESFTPHDLMLIRLNNILYRCAEYLGRECSSEREDNWAAEPPGGSRVAPCPLLV